MARVAEEEAQVAQLALKAKRGTVGSITKEDEICLFAVRLCDKAQVPLCEGSEGHLQFPLLYTTLVAGKYSAKKGRGIAVLLGEEAHRAHTVLLLEPVPATRFWKSGRRDRLRLRLTLF